VTVGLTAYTRHTSVFLVGHSITPSRKSKSVVKLSRYRHADDNGQRQYSSYSFLTLALDGGDDQSHAPAALYPRYPLDRRMGLRSGLDTEATGKILCLRRDRTPVVEPVVRHYTDRTTLGPIKYSL
jgi:hypothetical protein